MFLNQDDVIENINAYLVCKHNKVGFSERGDLLYRVDVGLCAGFVAYWLYLMRNDEAGFFQHRLQYLANWDAEEFTRSTKLRDEIVEQFLDNVLLLNEPRVVIGTARQSDLDVSFDLGLATAREHVDAAEFSLSFIFNQAELEKLIPTFALPNKMIRFGSGLHVIGLMYKNSIYNLYDPNCQTGPIEVVDIKEIAKTIFIGFSQYCKSKEYIALNISAYDLTGATPGNYFNPEQYCFDQLSSVVVKQQVLQHKFLFLLLARYNEYKVMDLLFANGYEYIPSYHNGRTEMNNAVMHGDLQMVNYLVDHDIPVDNKNIPLAIDQKSSEILYLLLAAGGVANVRVKGQKTYLDLALENEFPEAIVLLLAGGMDLNKEGKQAIEKKYGTSGMLAICTHAVQLQKSFLPLPEVINIKAADILTLSAYAKRYKLVHQLGLPLEGVVIILDGVVVPAHDVIHKIQQIFIQHSLDNEFGVVEKVELETVLDYFDPKMKKKIEYAKNRFYELSRATIPIAEHLSQHTTVSKREIANAQWVLEQILNLSIDFGFKHGDNDVTKAKGIIYEYLIAHHLQTNHRKSNYIFFSLNQTKNPVTIEYSKDVERLLKDCKLSLRNL